MKSLVVAMVLVLASTLPARSQQIVPLQDRPKIIVSAEAVVETIPNRIAITFGIETTDHDITIAKQKNNEVLKKALAAIKACGVPEKEIQTDQLSIRPVTPYRAQQGKAVQTVQRQASFDSDAEENGPEKRVMYQVSNTLQITLRDPKKVEELMSTVLPTGVTHLYGLVFQTTEFKNLSEQARESALKAAKEKAEKMAAVLGQSVGEPLEIRAGWSGAGDRGAAPEMANDFSYASGDLFDADSSSTGTVALGKLAIRANVSVMFELKK